MLLQQQHQDNNNNNSEDDDDADQQQHELNKRSATQVPNYRTNRGQVENYFKDQKDMLLNWQLEIPEDETYEVRNESISERELVKRSTPSGSATVCAPVRYVDLICNSSTMY